MISILFLGAEHASRAVLAEVLRHAGHTVLEAADLSEALRACKDYGDPIDLAIINAEEGAMAAAKRLEEKYPDLRFLFIGGREWRSRMRLPSNNSAWLEKPFTSQSLLQIVRAVTGPRVSHAGE